MAGPAVEARRLRTPSIVLELDDIGDGDVLARAGRKIVGKASVAGPKGDPGTNGTNGVDGATGPAGPATAAQYASENKSGGTLPAGTAVAAHTSGVGIVGALATGVARSCVGMLLAPTLNGVAGNVLLEGPVTLADWTAIVGTAALTRGPYFLDPTTPGALTAIAPSAVGQLVQVVGYAVAPDTLNVNPSAPTLL